MRWYLWLVLTWAIARAAQADGALAREYFEQGLAAAAQRSWFEAIRHFEASLAEEERPACRFNLLVAYREADRPLEVARHAFAFLSSVENRSHTNEAAEARVTLEQALWKLAVLRLDELPQHAELKVDGQLPQVVHERAVYVLPGRHRLSLVLANNPAETLELELAPGTSQAWPRVRPAPHAAPVVTRPNLTTEQRAQSAPPAPPVLRKTSAPTSMPKRRLSIGMGVAGAALMLAGITTHADAARRANARWNMDAFGYYNAVKSYQRRAWSVMPLAFSGGALMATASALASRKVKGRVIISVATLTLGALAAGLGVALLVREPKPLVAGTEYDRPSREAGSLLLSSALPLLTYGICLHVK